jgi:Na+-transporting NADH:ubiquinone oxidoreductase subunit C
MNREGLPYTVLVTFVVSFVFVGLLAFANELTKEKAENNALIRERRAVLNALGIAYSGDAEVLDVYQREVQQAKLGSLTVERATVDGRTVEAVRFSGPGLWGTITGVIGVTADLSTIVGLDIISQSETPGLGGRIGEDWWKAQFRGERIPPAGRIDVVAGSGRGDKDKSNGRVDAVTGATITSNAMKSIINKTLLAIKEASR